VEKETAWANPSAAGIIGLCCAITPLVILKLGWVGPEGAPILIGWLITGGLLQIVAGIIEARRGGLLFSTPLLILGFTATIAPAIGELVKIWIKGGAVPPTLSGVGFIVIAIWAIALFVASGLVSKFLFFLMGILDLALWLLGLSMLGVLGQGSDMLGSYLLLVFLAGMIYVACALFLNELFEKELLPIGKPVFTK